MVQAPVSGNEARVAGWGGRPAQWSALFVNDRGVVSRPAPVNLADDGAWCLAGAVPGMQLIVEPWLLLWMGAAAPAVQTSTSCWRWWAALWRGHPAHRCRPSSVVRASGCRHSSFQVNLSSKLCLSIRAYSERERQGGGRQTYPVPSRSSNQGCQ